MEVHHSFMQVLEAIDSWLIQELEGYDITETERMSISATLMCEMLGDGALED